MKFPRSDHPIKLWHNLREDLYQSMRSHCFGEKNAPNAGQNALIELCAEAAARFMRPAPEKTWSVSIEPEEPRHREHTINVGDNILRMATHDVIPYFHFKLMYGDDCVLSARMTKLEMAALDTEQGIVTAEDFGKFLGRVQGIES